MIQRNPETLSEISHIYIYNTFQRRTRIHIYMNKEVGRKLYDSTCYCL